MHRLRKQAGFSLVELMISAAVFGILLVTVTSVFSSGSRISNAQIIGAEANEVSELAMLRISEALLQAHYIYPAGHTITIDPTDSAQNNRSFVTGQNALALLIPEGSTYCPSTGGQSYCAYLYSLENRSSFSSLLSFPAEGSLALVEWRVGSISWPKDIVPATSLRTWTNVTWGIVADSLAASSDLASASNLSLALEEPLYDDSQIFGNTTSKTAARSLIVGVTPTLTISYGNAKTNTKTSYIYSRSIPRAALPNP